MRGAEKEPADQAEGDAASRVAEPAGQAAPAFLVRRELVRAELLRETFRDRAIELEKRRTEDRDADGGDEPSTERLGHEPRGPRVTAAAA